MQSACGQAHAPLLFVFAYLAVLFQLQCCQCLHHLAMGCCAGCEATAARPARPRQHILFRCTPANHPPQRRPHPLPPCSCLPDAWFGLMLCIARALAPPPTVFRACAPSDAVLSAKFASPAPVPPRYALRIFSPFDRGPSRPLAPSPTLAPPPLTSSLPHSLSVGAPLRTPPAPSPPFQRLSTKPIYFTASTCFSCNCNLIGLREEAMRERSRVLREEQRGQAESDGDAPVRPPAGHALMIACRARTFCTVPAAGAAPCAAPRGSIHSASGLQTWLGAPVARPPAPIARAATPKSFWAPHVA